MPRFHFRLEAQDGSGHFRQGTVHSPTVEEARAFLERSELSKVGFRLTTDEHEKIAGQLDDLAAVAVADDGCSFDGFTKKARTLADRSAELRAHGVRVPGEIRGRVVLHEQDRPYAIAWLGGDKPARDPERKPPHLRGGEV